MDLARRGGLEIHDRQPKSGGSKFPGAATTMG